MLFGGGYRRRPRRAGIGQHRGRNGQHPPDGPAASFYQFRLLVVGGIYGRHGDTAQHIEKLKLADFQI